MRLFLIGAISVLLMSACDSKKEEKLNLDNVDIQRIIVLQNEKNVTELIQYFVDPSAQLREKACMAFASIKDTAALNSLYTMLEDANENVAQAAAFAIGQTASESSVKVLKKVLERSMNEETRYQIFVAIGKCGSVDENYFLASNYNIKKDARATAWALFYLSAKRMINEAGIDLALKILENESDDHTRLGAAHAIARSTLSKPWASLLPLFKAEKNNEVQMAIAAGLAGISADSVQVSLIDFVQKTSHNSQINFIKSVHLLQDDLIYNYCSSNILSEKNIDLQLASAEYLSNYPDYCALFLGTVNLDSLNWRVRSMLLAAVITLQDDEYINYVRARYHESENLYERGSLLAIIATLPGVKEEIQQEILANDSIICTYGLDAYYGLLENESEEERRKEAPFLMDCLSSGSASVVTYSAYLLRDSIFISAENIEKLKSIAKQLNTAKMAEANAVLLNTIAFMEGREMGDDSAFEIQAISQDEIASLMNIRGFRVITNKGEIIMEAKAFEAPGTVLTIARLIDEGYYNGKLFHRVVPNFVIQTGCPNGDGWGTLDFTMRSEFSRLMYSTGAVGMASSGQDTESCQWFITHSPTPHLNGKYTLFAYVSSGMDVVQNIEIGDQILSMELLYTN